MKPSLRSLCAFLVLFLPTVARAAPSFNDDAQFEHLVLVQLNRVRANPPEYAQYLATLRPRYQPDGLYTRPGQNPVRTREGVAALDDAIRALRHSASASRLAVCNPLIQSAREHAADQARTGAIGHGTSPFQRLSRHGQWLDAAAENIAYGSMTPERVVADLIIDDGQPSRGHRTNILNGAFHVVGVGVNRHPRYGVVCVIDFAGGFVEH